MPCRLSRNVRRWSRHLLVNAFAPDLSLSGQPALTQHCYLVVISAPRQDALDTGRSGNLACSDGGVLLREVPAAEYATRRAVC